MTYPASDTRCDIVLPVYNGLTYVRRCVNALLAYTAAETCHVYIMDDASDAMTAAYLQDIAQQYPHITLVRNRENLGFVKNCNKGMALGRSPYVLLLNSDVIVTPNWLEALLEAAEANPSVAAVNPLTNYAANINLPMAPGLSFLDMHDYVQQNTSHEVFDVVTSVGFCLLLRRAALENVGMFDEVFGMGYCEESDLAMRLTSHGWRTVTAPWVYVYHKGGASFTQRDERYLKNRAIFDERWKKEYLKQWKAFCKADPFAPLRGMFACNSRFAPLPSMRSTYLKLRHAWRQRNLRAFAVAAIRGTLALPHARRPIVDDAYIDRLKPANDRLRVTYVLPTLDVAGGVISVIQLVNEMVLKGIDARIAALYEEPEIRNWPFHSEPMLYASRQELIDNLPHTDILVATHWMTADWVAELNKRGKTKKTVYFLQDYEAWFYPENNAAKRAEVRDTYALIHEKIVKSDWLAGMLANDGYATHKIRLGMNLDVFYPRDTPKRSHKTVMAMARPRTPNRGYDDVIAALKLVKEAQPDTQIVLFGDKIPQENLPFEAMISGVVTDQNTLAQLYSEADVFLDGSVFQGFGRPALEAMACGTACVVTHVGGVNEYARHGENCLTVPPQSPESFATAILQLLDDDGLRARLISGGLATASLFCHRREARETLAFVEQVLEENNPI
jgi:GT2 family glycosyltransferase/glycosyltransferase involved in cell wall biosynthesis